TGFRIDLYVDGGRHGLAAADSEPLRDRPLATAARNLCELGWAKFIHRGLPSIDVAVIVGLPDEVRVAAGRIRDARQHSRLALCGIDIAIRARPDATGRQRDLRSQARVGLAVVVAPVILREGARRR